MIAVLNKSNRTKSFINNNCSEMTTPTSERRLRMDNQYSGYYRQQTVFSFLFRHVFIEEPQSRLLVAMATGQGRHNRSAAVTETWQGAMTYIQEACNKRSSKAFLKNVKERRHLHNPPRIKTFSVTKQKKAQFYGTLNGYV